jgi:hypothetical protein
VIFTKKRIKELKAAFEAAEKEWQSQNDQARAWSGIFTEVSLLASDSPKPFSILGEKQTDPEIFRVNSFEHLLRVLEAEKLPPMREVAFETLPACPGHGYVITNDGFSARYLPGRNVIIATASKPLTHPGEKPETLVCTLQADEWNLLAARWRALDGEIQGSKSLEEARNAGMTGIEFLELAAKGLGVHQYLD